MSKVLSLGEIEQMSPKQLKMYAEEQRNLKCLDYRKIAQKKYYENNKEVIDEYRKAYSFMNKDKACETSKKYYAENKLEILAARKEKYNCIACNINMTIHNKSRHEKSKTHLENIKNLIV